MMKMSGTVLNVSGISTNAPFLKNLIGHTDIGKNADLQAWRVILRNSDEYIDFSFTMPPIVHLQILCRSPANLRILESLIPNEIMDMLHAGDTRGALQALGVHDETPTSIIDSLTTSLRKELDQQRRKYEFSKTLDYSSDSAKQKSLEVQEAKIQSLVSRIDTIEKRMSEIETANCPICYSDIETPTLTPCCKNVFCFACLCESLKRQAVCPLCRGAITSVSELHVVNKAGNTIVQETDGPKTKTEEFLQFVESNPAAKILLFSEFDASFVQLQNEMSRRDIKFSAINGSTARISNILSAFDAGDFRVLFLNSRHVGAGLNIISATDVFLFHKMTSEMEKQIIGRAYRIGRKQPLRVHHLLYQSEIKPS
jgi:SNF2 family DNA or RNA helicase